MKITLSFVLSFLIFCNAYAFEMICGGPVSSGCSASTNEVGNRNTGGSTSETGSNYMSCQLFTPDCSGNLNTAYIHHSTTDSDYVKLAIYLDDGDSTIGTGGDNDDTLVESSAEISSSAVEWASVALTSNEAVSTGSNYWLCRITSGSQQWNRSYSSTGGTTWTTSDCNVCYNSPPSTLYNASWAWSSSTSNTSFYMSIGD